MQPLYARSNKQKPCREFIWAAVVPYRDNLVVNLNHLHMKHQLTFFAAFAAASLFVSCTKNVRDDSSAITEPLSASADLPEVAASIHQEPGSAYVQGEILVRFRGTPTETSRRSLLARVGGTVEERIVTASMKRVGDQEGITRVRTGMEVMDAVARMKQDLNVLFAEPNYIYVHEALSNDSYFGNGSLWGMYGDGSSPANQYGSQAAEAWAAGHTGSSSVFVGVIDEGAMYNHEDIAGNYWTNSFDPVDGIDNDRNGYIDDTHGWDFAGNDNSTFDGATDDHGTHVSGTIGGRGGNGRGVAGINWSVTMISAKFLGRNGGTTANAIKAVDYITDLKTRHGLNIVATNNSWGGGGFSQGLQDAIGRANAAGILFVAAAGNGGSDGVGDNNDVTANYPSNYPNDNIIAVAAITSSGGRASFSNYGATKVDIGAPGSGIYSTVPTRSNGSGYSSYSGTSMATPHVTGACALYASTHAGASAATIKNAILSSAVPTTSLAGKCVSGGRLNVSGF
jgi:subtilisin family serine protease